MSWDRLMPAMWYAMASIIKEAYAQKLVTNEDNWLIMLNDRNMTSHIYKEEMAEEIAKRMVNCYVKEFKLLLHRMMK